MIDFYQHSILAFLLAMGLFSGSAAGLASDAVLLSNVDTITVRQDRMTSNRRVPAVPQVRYTFVPNSVAMINKMENV
jgi:hypothetical protein